MDIDKYKISVRGFSDELEGELDRNKDAELLVPVSIVDVRTPSNEDGTFNNVYVAKKTSAIKVIQTEKEVKVKEKNSQSKLLRGRIYWHGQGRGVVDSESYYKDMTAVLMSDEMLDMAQAKLDIEKYR